MTGAECVGWVGGVVAAGPVVVVLAEFVVGIAVQI